MTKSKQLNVGNESEKEVAVSFFRANGYWSYITPKKISGQPVDIIAMKGNINWLVDAKHLIADKKSFAFSRIESNQMDSLNYAKSKGVKNLGFVIIQDNGENGGFNDFFLPFDKLIEMLKKDEKSVKLSELESFREALQRASEN